MKRDTLESYGDLVVATALEFLRLQTLELRSRKTAFYLEWPTVVFAFAWVLRSQMVRNLLPS